MQINYQYPIFDSEMLRRGYILRYTYIGTAECLSQRYFPDITQIVHLMSIKAVGE